MKILAIETSCDETALSITEQTQEDRAISVLANNVLTQIDLHREFGGVYPNLAKREHSKALTPLLIKTLADAGLHTERTGSFDETLIATLTDMLTREPEMLEHTLNLMPHVERPDIDAIALTAGPGLEPALWVGINFAKALSLIWNIPILPVNHMEGHLLASAVSGTTSTDGHHTLALDPIEFPALGLLVSGGHTELVLFKGMGEYELLGETRDDAVGEAFDKVARLLGLPYPGGPEISLLAELGEPKKYDFPRPMKNSGDYDFSFAGLKTSVRYMIEKKTEPLTEAEKHNIARDFEDACVEVLVHKTIKAAEQYGAKAVLIGGGVSANKKLRTTLKAQLDARGVPLLLPDRGLSTDNALMIGLAAHLHPRENIDPIHLKARGHWRIHEK
jgi:N6-L-threonylcarbamoyladenine synthase